VLTPTCKNAAAGGSKIDRTILRMSMVLGSGFSTHYFKDSTAEIKAV
jgi:hypothetical protein